MIIYSSNYRKNLILFWRQYYPSWEIPKGFHVHHITPLHLCKSLGWPKERIHHPKNLIALHPDDHRSIHIHRGDKVLSNGYILSIKTGNDNPAKSEEVRRKISEKLKNRPVSDETKYKLSIIAKEWHKNHPNYFVGRTLSEDTIKKIKEKRALQPAMSAESRKKISDWNKSRENPFRKPFKELVGDKYDEICLQRSIRVKGDNNPMRKKKGTFFLIHNGITTKNHPKDLPIPDGWTRGRHSTSRR